MITNFRYNLIALVALSSVLTSSCSKVADGDGSVQITQGNTRLEEPALFSGDRVETIVITPRAINYNLKFKLQSDTPVSLVSYSDVSPPMPLIAEGLAMYQLGDKYKLVLTHEDNSSSEVLFDISASEVSNIGVSSLSYGSVVTVNGNDVWSGSRLKPIKNVIVGRGYKSRYWAGRLFSLSICDENNNSLSSYEILRDCN